MPARRRRVTMVALALPAALLTPVARAATCADTKAPPAGAVVCTGVRPGSGITSLAEDAGGTSYCTVGFLLRGSDGRAYVLTSGACAKPNGIGPEGEWTWKGNSGPRVVEDTRGTVIGRYVYRHAKSLTDVGLIRLDKGVKWDAQACHFGGPTGIATELTNVPTPLRYLGPHDPFLRASVLGPMGRDERLAFARPGVAPTGFERSTWFTFDSPGFYEFGAPAFTDDGRALGIVSQLDIEMGEYGVHKVTRLTPLLAHIGKRLRITLTLATAAAL